jgi:glutamine amidotransferase
MTIGVIDIGGSNLGSVVNILDHLNIKKKVLTKFDKKNFDTCDKIILPGVGSFKKAMENLKKNNFINPLNRAYKDKIPVLGICLGMQLMCRSSVEGGESEGLNWFDLDVKKFNIKKVGKIPIIGWNSVYQKKNQIFYNIPKNADFYFLHSYYVPLSEKYTIGKSNVNFKYSSIIKKNNIYGFQFHPEKSQKYGIQIIKNFINNSC